VSPLLDHLNELGAVAVWIGAFARFGQFDHGFERSGVLVFALVKDHSERRHGRGENELAGSLVYSKPESFTGNSTSLLAWPSGSL